MKVPNHWAEIACVAVSLVWLGLIWIWPNSIYLFCFDDSFYYFEIARNFADGHFSTFDRISPTNGYHPLWMLLCVPVYAAGTAGDTAVRLLLSLQWLVWCSVLLLWIQIVRHTVGDWPQRDFDPQETAALRGYLNAGLIVLAALLAAGVLVVKTFVNGMESGIYVLGYTLLLYFAQRVDGNFIDNTSLPGRLGIAVLATLCFLARTDAGLMLLCFGLWSLPAAFGQRGRGIGRLCQLFLLPAAAIVAFLMTNQLLFGIPMQVSGELKRTAPAGLRLVALVAALLAPAAALLLLRGELGEKFPRVKRFLRQTGWFGIFVCLLFGYYYGFQTFPRLWYFGPALTYGLILVLIAYVDLLDGVLLESKPEASPTRMLMLTNSVMVVLGLAAVGMQAYSALQSGLIEMRVANRQAAEWISANLPPDAVLGCWDAGVLAYYTDQRVMNLDGFVNSPAYAKALKSGRAGPFLRNRDVGYVINHDLDEDGTAPQMQASASRLLDEPTVEQWKLVKKWPFQFSGSTNRSSAGTKQMAVFLFRLSDERDAPAD